MNNKDRALQLCFEDIVRAAVAGERCPLNGTRNMTSHLVAVLARTGRIKVEVYAKNWRTVTIMQGEHSGKSTMHAPAGHECYRVIDRQGSRPVGGTAEDKSLNRIERQRVALAAFREACAKYEDDQRRVRTNNIRTGG